MRADRVLLGFVAVLVGLGWLLVNLGLLPAHALRELWRYWPVLIILWGILLLLGRGDGGFGCLVGLVILALVATLVFDFSFLPFDDNQARETVVTDYELPLPEQEPALLQVNLFQGAGEMTLKEIPSSDELLVKAQVKTHAKASVDEKTDGDKAVVEIRDPDFSVNLRNRFSLWDVRLAQGIPLSLNIKTGAGQAEMDFRRLQVKNLEIDAGVGDMTIHLGTSGGDCEIEGGAANITFYVPQNVGLRLKLTSGIVNLDDGENNLVALGSREYESKNIDDKDVIVNIKVTMGAGAIKILPSTEKGLL